VRGVYHPTLPDKNDGLKIDFLGSFFNEWRKELGLWEKGACLMGIPRIKSGRRSLPKEAQKREKGQIVSSRFLL
jgi:hypothetical protein